MKDLTKSDFLSFFEKLENSKALGVLTNLIQNVLDMEVVDDVEIAFLERLLNQFENRKLSGSQIPTLHCLRANYWQTKRKKMWQNNPKLIEFNISTEMQESLFEYRQCIRHDCFIKQDDSTRSNVMHMFALYFGETGRFAESIRLMDEILEFTVYTAHMLYNKASFLTYYANSLYDENQKFLFANKINEILEQANSLATHEEKSKFGPILENLFNNIKFKTKNISMDYYKEKMSPEILEYKKWAQKNKLLLNPLNDIYLSSIIVDDDLNLSSNIFSDGKNIEISNFFNRIKNEFELARLLYYEGFQMLEHRISSQTENTDVSNENQNISEFNLPVEKIRTAFRVTYSIFDKIATLLNMYFKIKKNAREVSFKNIWIDNNKNVCNFMGSPNISLRGLFWLSKDFVEEQFKATAEPEAKELDIIRNYIEHRFLDINVENINSIKKDVLYSISLSDFNVRTLNLIKLAREAIVYLCLAIHRNEYLLEHKGKGDIFSNYPHPAFKNTGQGNLIVVSDLS